MKKMLSLTLLLLLLLPGFARAGSSAPLLPAYDETSGKEGYIDVNGHWGILPQFESAGMFRGRYAAVSTGDPWEYTMGIIDETGAWVVEPHYFVDEGYDGWTYGGLNEGLYQVWDEDMNTGFFDVPSGYYSGLVFGCEFRWWTQERLVPIGDGFYERTNGQCVISLPEGYETDWCSNLSVFTFGFAPIVKDDDENPVCFTSEHGEIIEPNHLQFEEKDWACGLLRATEKEANPDATPLTGYFDLTAMDWRITSCTLPDGQVCRFLETYPFSGDGYACVKLEDGEYGHIDTQGNLLFHGSVTLNDENGGEIIAVTQPYRFYRDIAWIEEAGALIDPLGSVVLRIPEGWFPHSQEDDEMDDTKDYYVSSGGVVELWRPARGGGYETALMKLNGEWLLDPEIYSRNWGYDCSPESHRFFSEGLQSVVIITGIKEWRTVHNVITGDYQEPVYETRVGYVNEQGNIVVDFLYDDGGAFINGLAMVTKGDQTGYVNSRGEEVFFWNYAVGPGNSPE